MLWSVVNSIQTFFLSKFGKILILTSQVASNPQFISELQIETFKSGDGNNRMNMSFNVLKDIKKAIAYITIKSQTNKKQNDYDREVFKGQIDFCKASQGIVGNFFTKMLSDGLGEHSNYQFMCATKARFYHFSNFPLVNENAFPSFMPKELYGRFVIFTKVQGKMSNNKPFVMLITINMFGELVKD